MITKQKSKIKHQALHDADQLAPEFLLVAYCHGYFPMAESRTGPVHWYSPDPRAILELQQFRVSRSLHQALKKNLYEVRVDSSFETVIRSCGARGESWISEEIVRAYTHLCRMGYAHSVESWRGDELAGGLYGVSIGGAFFGESMFHREVHASSYALVFLVERLLDRGFELLDIQFMTDHFARLGAVEIPREDYLARLRRAVRKPCSFG
ncbi:MAG TPA: leucyl/phenylalanyl-tRNA--protein transferase [Bacteroidota bacterium]